MDINNKLKTAIEALSHSLRVLRAGRANSAMVENIEVNVYDSKMPLQQVASISIPQSNQILIQPWDVQNLEVIQNAITKSDLGINPIVEGNTIRLTLPPMTEETRKNLVKEAHQFGEEARISIRSIRESIIRELEEKEDRGDISEDDKFKQKDNIQTSVNEYNKKIEEVVNKKEKEILEE